MRLEKQQYYINIHSGEISRVPYQNNDQYVIYATPSDIRRLRSTMDQMHDASMRSFWRSHIPIVPYHQDQPNDEYDANLVEALKMIYNLGDEDTRSHIQSMGILDH